MDLIIGEFSKITNGKAKESLSGTNTTTTKVIGNTTRNKDGEFKLFQMEISTKALFSMIKWKERVS